MEKSLEGIKKDLEKLKPFMTKIKEVQNHEEKIKTVNMKLARELDEMDNKRILLIKSRRKVDNLREQIKVCEKVQNLAISKEERLQRMKEIEKSIDLSKYSSVDETARGDYIKGLKSDELYYQQKYQTEVDRQQKLNSEVDELRFERGKLILEKNRLEQFLDSLLKSYEDIKVEDEGLTQTEYIYKIKEDLES